MEIHDGEIMRYKTIPLILALTVISWAQTSTPNSNSNPQAGTESSEKAKCSCCDKSATDKGVMACARHGKHAKAMASCCDGKDGKCCAGDQAKACMRGDKNCCKDCMKDKTASCGAKCDKNCKTGCCNREKKMETASAK
jgi:hypothetical protein